jgi:ABC-type multidrug transport system ATPase subunit
LKSPTAKIFGLVGESGTGKTSILRMLAGLLTADEGDCEIAGEDSNRGLDYETAGTSVTLPNLSLSLVN